MKTAKFYDSNDVLQTAYIMDMLPSIGEEFPGTGAVVFAIEEPWRAYIDSSDESISNGSVHLVRAEYPDDGGIIERYVLVPADMTWAVDAMVENLLDYDCNGVTHMTEEEAAETLANLRANDYKNEIPADLTAAELARRFNEVAGTYDICTINLNIGEGRQTIYWNSEDHMLHTSYDGSVAWEAELETLDAAQKTAMMLYANSPEWDPEFIGF